MSKIAVVEIIDGIACLAIAFQIYSALTEGVISLTSISVNRRENPEMFRIYLIILFILFFIVAALLASLVAGLLKF